MALPCLTVAYSWFFKKFNTWRFLLGKNRLPRDHEGIYSIEKIIGTEAINIGGLLFELQFLGVLVQNYKSGRSPSSFKLSSETG